MKTNKKIIAFHSKSSKSHNTPCSLFLLNLYPCCKHYSQHPDTEKDFLKESPLSIVGLRLSSGGVSLISQKTLHNHDMTMQIFWLFLWQMSAGLDKYPNDENVHCFRCNKVDLIMIEFPSHALYETAPGLLNSKWRISIVDGD